MTSEIKIPIWRQIISSNSITSYEDWQILENKNVYFIPLHKIIIDHITDIEPRIESFVGKDKLYEYSVISIRICHSIEIFDRKHIAHYAYLAMYLGLYFAFDPQYAPISNALLDTSNYEQTRMIKIDYLMEQYFIKAIGKNFKNRENALRKFASMQRSTIEKMIESEISLFSLAKELWPQKYRFQKEYFDTFYRVSLKDSELAGFDSKYGPILFTMIGFFLGRHFLINPFHHWVRLVFEKNNNFDVSTRFYTIVSVMQDMVKRDMIRQEALENVLN